MVTSLGLHLWITAHRQQLLLTELGSHWCCALKKKEKDFIFQHEIPGVIFCDLNSRER